MDRQWPPAYHKGSSMRPLRGLVEVHNLTILSLHIRSSPIVYIFVWGSIIQFQLYEQLIRKWNLIQKYQTIVILGGVVCSFRRGLIPGKLQNFGGEYYCQGPGVHFRLSCSHRELTKDHVLTSTYVNIFRTVTRSTVNRGVWRKTEFSWRPLNKHAMNIWLSENQSTPKLENRKASPCSPCAPNLLHVLVSRIIGYHNLCSPAEDIVQNFSKVW